MARFTGYGQIGMPTAYLMGGGTIGGPNVWDFSSGRPQLSQSARQAGVATLPSGALSRQEVRNRQDVQQILQSGVPYVEMPTRYQINERGQYVDPLTGKTMGSISINYSAGGWRNAEGEDMASGGGYSPNVQARRARQGKKPEGPESGGYKESGGPQPSQTTQRPTTTGALSFTPFGERVYQEFPPTLAGGLRLWYDEDIPQFPYSY
jgi:hypothetical protein